MNYILRRLSVFIPCKWNSFQTEITAQHNINNATTLFFYCDKMKMAKYFLDSILQSNKHRRWFRSLLSNKDKPDIKKNTVLHNYIFTISLLTNASSILHWYWWANINPTWKYIMAKQLSQEQISEFKESLKTL